MKRKIFTILTIIWMVVIFMFSSRTGIESTSDSYKVGYLFGNMAYLGFSQLSEEKQLAFASKVDYPIRKSAHCLEYSILALFAYPIFDENKKTFILCFLNSISDEVHQLFVEGRSGKISDVFIDCFGIILMLVVIEVIKRSNIKKVQSNR